MPVKLNGKLISSPIKIESRDATSSCNTQTVFIHPDRFSHWLGHEKHKRLVLRPIIDTISVTIHGEAAWELLQKPITSKLDPGKVIDRQTWWAQVAAEFDAKASSPKYVHLGSSKRRIPKYRYNFDVRIQGCKSTPLLSFKSAAAKQGAPLRLELHPDRFKPEHLDALSDIWSEVAGDEIPFAALFPDARVTRLDLAVDLLNVRAANVYAHHPKIWKIWTCSNPQSGGETWYYHFRHHNKTTPTQSYLKPSALTVYDKRANEIDWGREPEYGSAPHTRIEMRHSANTIMKNILEFRPKLEDWTIVRAGLEDADEQAAERRKMDTIRLRGFEKAQSLHDGVPSDPQDLANMFTADIIAPDYKAQLEEALRSGSMGQMVAWATASVADSI